MGSSLQEQRTQGDVLLERLDKVVLPPEMERAAGDFRKVHAELKKASERVVQCEVARDDVLDTVGEADALLDGAVDDLAAQAAGARLGPRSNPFKTFHRLPPSSIKELSYATEPREVRLLVQAMLKAKPPETVVTAAAACLQQADAVDAALLQLAGPQADYKTAQADRDAVIPRWKKALRRLRAHAGVHLEDQPNLAKALVAPPDRVQVPRAKPSRKRKAPEAPQ